MAWFLRYENSKNYQFKSQVTITRNQLHFVFAAVDQVINKTVAYGNTNSYLTFKILIKFCSSPLKASSYQQKRLHCVIVCTTHNQFSKWLVGV